MTINFTAFYLPISNVQQTLIIITVLVFKFGITTVIVSSPFKTSGMPDFIGAALALILGLFSLIVACVLCFISYKSFRSIKQHGKYFFSKKTDIKVISVVLLIVIPTSLFYVTTNYIAAYKKEQAQKAYHLSMINHPFVCAYEKDHNPPLSAEAEHYYLQAVALDKGNYLPLELLQTIEQNYKKAVELNHWKAMDKLAALYQKGRYAKGDKMGYPTGIKPDKGKALALYVKMAELKVPMGYYNWSIAIERGLVQNTIPDDARLALTEAVRLGSPLAQVRFGNFFAYRLPLEEQRHDLAEQYFRCAGAQDNIQALQSVAEFYNDRKQNKPKAMYYYQKAASLGSEKALHYLSLAFSEDPSVTYDFGYEPDLELSKKYTELYYQLRKNSELRFPNLMEDYPLPRHPTQGYDADNPDVRPEEKINKNWLEQF